MLHSQGATISEICKQLEVREIENNPGNWNARATLEKVLDEEFKESFDIATDGINFKNYLSNHWYKVK